MLKNKKAQVWAIDLTIAFVIFIGIIFLFYKYSISFAPEEPTTNKLIRDGTYASSLLLSTGYPENWNELGLNQTNSLGLIDSEGFLDINKVDVLAEWINNGIGENYTLSKTKMNLKYDYLITFTNISGEVLNPIGLIFQDKNPKQVVKIKRLVVFSNNTQIQPIKLNLYLWTNQSVL